MARRARYTKRRGEAYYPSSAAALPPAQERVHRSYLIPQEDWVNRWDVSGQRRLTAFGAVGRFPVSSTGVASVHYGPPPPPKGSSYGRSTPRGRFGALRQLVMRVPARVRFCMQRKSRREVLFARGVAGRRGSAPGPYRRRVESNYSC